MSRQCHSPASLRAVLRQQRHASTAHGRAGRRGVLVNQRVRGVPRVERRSFVPPETWHEPRETAGKYRIVIQPAGPGYRHLLTPSEVRARLAQLPPQFLSGLEVVQLSRMTRKKQSFPCYGMQWGATIYLYPIEENLVEEYHSPPTPAQENEVGMYGGRWVAAAGGIWRLEWTLDAVRDFYLNNILIHELGHVVDQRNTRHGARERYAEWFALEYGYRRSRRLAVAPRPVVRRHG